MTRRKTTNFVIEPISYEDMYFWVCSRDTKSEIPTLGGRSYIFLTPDIVIGRNAFIITGKNGASMEVTPTYWETLCRFVEGVPNNRRDVSSEYSHAPRYRFAPGLVAALKLFWLERGAAAAR